MPCYDGRPVENEHNSRAAQLLCGVLRDLEAAGLGHIISEDLKSWWADHKRRDANRIFS
jgi:hypothetical protein